MPDPVAQLTGVVGDALSASSFTPTIPAGSKESYSADTLRQLHANAVAGRVGYPTVCLYTMDVHTETSRRAALVNVLRKQLSPVTDETGRVSFLELQMTLDDLAVATLRAAAIHSPEEAATVIHYWLEGGPWIQTYTVPLAGITVSEPLNVRPGMSFRQLPEQAHQMYGHVPNTVANALHRGRALQHDGLLGATVLCFEHRIRPVLRNVDQTPGYNSEWPLPGGLDMFHPFLRALSLVCNTPVEDDGFTWWGSTPVQDAFDVRGSDGWRMPIRLQRPQDTRVQLTCPLVERALRLTDKLQSPVEHHRRIAERVLGRWMNSFHQTTFEDQLIDARIALESLYAAGGTHEASLRVAYHGARHLGRDLEERKALYRDLRDIYHNASAVIHGGTLKKPEKAADLAKRARSITREALLKILEDGETPKWADLMLDDV